MKIKMTSTIEDKGLRAGLIYDVPLEEAQDYIANHQAIIFGREVAEVTNLSDDKPVYIEGDAPKKGKNK